jgi:hypothetical protein
LLPNLDFPLRVEDARSFQFDTIADQSASDHAAAVHAGDRGNIRRDFSHDLCAHQQGQLTIEDRLPAPGLGRSMITAALASVAWPHSGLRSLV